MRNSNIELVENPKRSIEQALEIYKRIVDVSDGDLDQYVNGEVLNIENSSLEKHIEEFQEFLDIVIQLYAVQNSDILTKKLEDTSQNNKCAVFLNWLNEYAESASYVMKETLFIQKMDVDNFGKMTEFCMENFVLKNSGEYVEENNWDKKELRILKNVINTAAELRITENLSEKYAVEILRKKMFLDAEYSKIVLRMIDKNYELMWRTIFIRRQKNIDEKLDRILSKYQ